MKQREAEIGVLVFRLSAGCRPNVYKALERLHVTVRRYVLAVKEN